MAYTPYLAYVVTYILAHLQGHCPETADFLQIRTSCGLSKVSCANLWLGHRRAIVKPVQRVRPELHNRDALIPAFSARVAAWAQLTRLRK
ncbi:hypothetical protein PP1Y_Lpl1479 (plasmid) [Novosphingobium sp. PP1Y]|nr:hypothetical protein PP1Y_Lpl1479 [Novosphingobium sp. PP1Y]